MPNSDCSGVNDTDAAFTRVNPGDSRLCKLDSNWEGKPYGKLATGLPKVVLCVGNCKIAGSPSLACAAPATPVVSAAEAAKKLLRKNWRRVSLKPCAVISCAISGARKFSGASCKRGGCEFDMAAMESKCGAGIVRGIVGGWRRFLLFAQNLKRGPRKVEVIVFLKFPKWALANFY